MHYKDLPLQCSPIKSTVWNEPNSTDDIWVSPYKVNYFMIDIQRLIIPRWAKCFVLLDSWTFCCPVLGSRHCTNTWPFLSAWHRSTAVQSAFSDMVMLTVWPWRVGSTLTEDACHPHPFSPSTVGILLYFLSMGIYPPAAIRPFIRHILEGEGQAGSRESQRQCEKCNSHIARSLFLKSAKRDSAQRRKEHVPNSRLPHNKSSDADLSLNLGAVSQQ